LASIIPMCGIHVIFLSKITPRYFTLFTNGTFRPFNVRRYSGALSQSQSQSQSQNQSHIATDGQSFSKSWCRAPSGAHDQIFITLWQLRSCLCRAPSLARGRVCLLYMLLTLASVVFLGSESLGTRDHILLSQIWDFTFRRLLRLAESRLRYSTPPPHGWGGLMAADPRYIASTRTAQGKSPQNSSIVRTYLLRPLPSNGRCLQCHYLATAVVWLILRLWPSSESTCHNTFIVPVS
jgi:hypothetical protein